MIPKPVKADLDVGVDVLDLTRRSANVLADLRIRSIRQLLCLPKTKLRQAPRLGRKGLAEVERFERAKQLTSYCGIVPTVHSSGEREQQGPITRQGRSEVRAVWIQAAHALVRSRQPRARPLQRWFHRVAYRRGKRTALVALARRMLSVAFYLLRDGTQYDPLRHRRAAA